MAARWSRTWPWSTCRSRGTARLTDVATECGLYYKKAQRLFAESLGVTPKYYSQIVRFTCALERLQAEPSTPLAEIAYDAGYADQSHFINEFRRFTNTTPAAMAAVSNSFNTSPAPLR